MCGDSTDPLNIKLLLQGQKADLVFTDPPYGVGFENVGVANDNQNERELIEFNRQWLGVMFDHLKENGSFYIWGTERSLLNIYAFILYDEEQNGKIVLRSLITWDKGIGQYQTAEHMRRYPVASEKCLFYMCGVQEFHNNKDHYNDKYEQIRLYLEGEAKKVGLTSKLLTEITGVQMFGHWFTKSQFTVIPEVHYKKVQAYYNGKAFSMSYEDMRKLQTEESEEWKALKESVMESRSYFDNTHENMNDVWHFNSPKGEEREEAGGHATPKPIALCSRAIKSSSREGESVLDFFGGSGSTLIACEQLNRTAYLMELEPKWCDVIIKRWETLTGEKAQLVQG